MSGVRLIVSDACLGLVEAAAEVFPEADCQRCVVHFYRNVLSHVLRRKVRVVAAMLKAMKLAAAAELVAGGIEETLTYYSFPSQH